MNQTIGYVSTSASARTSDGGKCSLRVEWCGALQQRHHPVPSKCGDIRCRWPTQWEDVHITAKELLPIIVASAVWGHQWRGCSVRCQCDNAAVVAIVRLGSSRDQRVMHLMRCLFFFMAYYQILWYQSTFLGNKTQWQIIFHRMPSPHSSRSYQEQEHSQPSSRRG